MINLLDLTQKELACWLESEGKKPFHARTILTAVHKKHILIPEEMLDLPLAIRTLIRQKLSISLPTAHTERLSTDGTIKWLFSIDAQNIIETVYIPQNNRGTLCISSQAGCALACTFCATGKQGFYRNLTVAEIVGQMLYASIRIQSFCSDHRAQKITNIVFMGMGEPLLNFEAVNKAIDIFLNDYSYGLARKKITLSTSGLVPYIDRLADRNPVSLAISLHATNDTLRSQLMPINKKYSLSRLLNASLRYIQFSPKPFVTFEYTMIDQINDCDQHLEELIVISRQVPCKINLIPWNPFPGINYRPSPRIHFFSDILSSHRVVTTIRRTRGDDIDAACGQLAGQITDKRTRSIHWIKRVGDNHA